MASPRFDTKLQVKLEGSAPPKGIDPKVFKACQDRLAADHRHRAERQQKRLREQLREVAQMSRDFGAPPEVPEGAGERLKARLEASASKEPPEDALLSGRNPTVFAPYASGGTFISRGGIHGFRLGFHPDTGMVGASCSAYFPGGQAYCELGCGFWMLAPFSVTLTVTVNARVWGNGLYEAPLGYAASYAALEANVAVFSGPAFSRFRRLASRNVIWDRTSIHGFEWASWDWQSRTATLLVPVNALDLLFVGAAAVQNAESAGVVAAAVSNFAFRVGPIATLP